MKIPIFRNFSVLLLGILLPLFLTSCTDKEVVGDDPEGLYRQAEDLYKDEKFLLAVEKYREVKNRYPYSSKAIEAELRIADCFFEQESYIEAESAYEVFKELHPTYPKIDYVQYRIAMSYYNQIPSVSTRDLSAVHRAMESFETLINKYPSSEYVAKARELQIEAKKKLADHENFVADFYYQRKHYLSASYRYASLLKDFPNLGYDEEALFRLGVCYLNTQMFTNAKDAFNRFLTKFPESAYRGQVESNLKNIP